MKPIPFKENDTVFIPSDDNEYIIQNIGEFGVCTLVCGTIKKKVHWSEFVSNYDIVRQYINDTNRQRVIDKPQKDDPMKAQWLPKSTIHDYSGRIIGYWPHNEFHYENGKVAGFEVPVFLPVIPHHSNWKFDMVSGKFYIK